MLYYVSVPFVLALLAPGAHAGFLDHDECFDEFHRRIDCPDHVIRDIELRRILFVVVPLGLLFLLFLCALISHCVKKRRAKKAFAHLDAPGGGPIQAYNVAAPQMEQGYAGQWAPPSQQVPNPFQDGQAHGQHVPNPFQGGQPYVPGPPPTLAHGGSYDTEPKENDGYASFQEVKINA